MFLNLAHTKMDIYVTTRSFVMLCYKLANGLPPEEKFNLAQQIRRAALTVQLNIAEGASRKSVIERKRYYEIARGSLIEVDAALDAVMDLQYAESGKLTELGNLLVRCFQMLSKMIN